MKLISKMIAGAITVMLVTGCGDVVVNVSKKEKNVDLSAVENFGALNLSNSEDFLQQMDQLQVVAIDLLITQMSQRDYKTLIRQSIRDYRTFLIDRASSEFNFNDPFYASANECREQKLSFNLDEANNFLGLILKTAVLAKVSEVSAAQLNPELSNELQAIGQIVLMELGLEIEGGVDVVKADGLTTTKGSVKIKLKEIEGEDVSAETKAKDMNEVLEISFERALGENYVGTFSSDISITHKLEDESIQKLAASLAVKRSENDENRMVHQVAFKIGPEGSVNYGRSMSFTQLENNKRMKLVDTVNPGTDAEAQYATIIDLDAFTQCKTALTADDNIIDEIGNENPDVEDETPIENPDTTDAGTDDDEVTTTDAVTTTDETDPTDGGEDEEVTPPSKGNPPVQNPGQNPGQHPGQSK